MNPGRQALLGIFMAVLSGALVLGSFSLSIAETGLPLAVVEAGAPTSTWTSAPITYAPGQPTFTTTPTPLPTNTSTPVPTTTNCPPPAGWDFMQIEAWHTLDGLASEHGISPDELAEANCLVGKTLPVGSVIWVPARPISIPVIPQPTACIPSPYAGWVIYQVRRGDTLFSIASRVGSSVYTLSRVNCISDPGVLRVGEDIWVPYVPPTFTPPPLPTYTPSSTLVPVNTPTLPPPSTAMPTATFAPTLTPSSSVQPTDTPVETSIPTFTLNPTDTPAPTDTIAPTDTQVPANTPVPTNTPNPYPYPDPSGSGLDVWSLYYLGGWLE